MARESAARKPEAGASPERGEGGERGERGERGARGAQGERGGRGESTQPEGLASVPGAAANRSPVELDRLIHERVRLGIVSALAVHDALSFNDLKAALEITDGNLSVHARKLEEAGYIACTKSFEGRMPRTEYRLTDAGRAALRRYLDHMEALIHRVREG